MVLLLARLLRVRYLAAVVVQVPIADTVVGTVPGRLYVGPPVTRVEKLCRLLREWNCEWNCCMEDIHRVGWKPKDHCPTCDKTMQSLCRRTWLATKRVTK